ncbi:MAG: acyl-CoA dehydrogenase family protein [Deltaproteobacteria bacterium]|nr:acyl-CoA dehydrogenase family protein [Deltaproteobacteria bacterium]MBW2419561.1 acyl-CoA dehydrogenase family protein [Deltaproteobacteria bacterium]
MDFAVDKSTLETLERIRHRGKTEARPIGLEADRLGRPIPADDPYFAKLIERGEGRTRWRGLEGEKKAKSKPRKTRSRPSTRTVTTLLVVEELAYWDRGVMVANPGVGLPETNVLAMGTDEQKERFLGPFLAPDRPRWASFGLTEPGAGSDAAAIQTTARKDGDHWILNGAKCFIGNATRSDWILVQATLDPSKGRAAQRSFFIEQGTPGLGGFRIEKKMGLKAYESTSFSMQDCRVPAANLLGGEERYATRAGFKSTLKAFNAGRPVVAANAVGIGRAAVDEALAFAREHDRLGDVRVRDRLEQAARKLKMARLLCLEAGWLADQQRPNRVEASMCKTVAARVGQDVTSLGMELIGSVGARGDHLIEKLYRDVKAMDIVEGTGQIQRIVMGRELLGLPR